MNPSDIADPAPSPPPAVEHDAFDAHELKKIAAIKKRLFYIEANSRVAHKEQRAEGQALRWLLQLVGVELPDPPVAITGAEVYIRTAPPGESRGGR